MMYAIFIFFRISTAAIFEICKIKTYPLVIFPTSGENEASEAKSVKK